MSVAMSRNHVPRPPPKQSPFRACRLSRPMKILVTGSSGHLGEALMRSPADPRSHRHRYRRRRRSRSVVGLHRRPRRSVDACMRGVDAVLHAATLHKPHVATHRRQDFIDANITGTLNLLEAAVANRGRRSFIFTSTTSTFGDALTPPRGLAGRVDHRRRRADAEEHLRRHQGGGRRPLPAVSSATRSCRAWCCAPRGSSRKRTTRQKGATAFADANLKANEFLYRRVDIEDVVTAHLLAMEKAPTLGFGKFIITATTPFLREDARELGVDAAAVLRRRVPGYEAIYARIGWKMLADARPRLRQRASAHVVRVGAEVRLPARAARRGLGHRPAQ